MFVERILGLSKAFFLQAGLGHTALASGKLCVAGGAGVYGTQGFYG